MKKITILFPVIASITIIWYLLTHLGLSTSRWFFPTIAIGSGILSLILPALASRFRIAYSIISFGLILLLLQIVQIFVPTISFWYWVAMIYIIAILTEFMGKNISVGDFLIDFLFSLIAAYLILLFNKTIITLVILLLNYIAVILFSVSFKFRGNAPEVDEDDDLDNE